MKFFAYCLAALWLSAAWMPAAFVINSYRFTTTGGGGDPYFSSVTLLLHCDGSNGSTTFTDNSSSAHTVSPQGNANLNTSILKFGSASCNLDGIGDYLIIPASSAFDFGTSDFTIEFWVRFVGSSQQYLFDFSNVNTSVLCITPSSGNLFVYSQGSFCINSGSTPFSTGTWYHIALVRSGGTWTVYRDGVQYLQATGQGSRTFGTNLFNLYWGIAGNGALATQANFDEIRITKGVARYASGFTPQSAAFPDY